MGGGIEEQQSDTCSVGLLNDYYAFLNPLPLGLPFLLPTHSTPHVTRQTRLPLLAR